MDRKLGWNFFQHPLKECHGTGMSEKFQQAIILPFPLNEWNQITNIKMKERRFSWCDIAQDFMINDLKGIRNVELFWN